MNRCFKRYIAILRTLSFVMSVMIVTTHVFAADMYGDASGAKLAPQSQGNKDGFAEMRNVMDRLTQDEGNAPVPAAPDGGRLIYAAYRFTGAMQDSLGLNWPLILAVVIANASPLDAGFIGTTGGQIMRRGIVIDNFTGVFLLTAGLLTGVFYAFNAMVERRLTANNLALMGISRDDDDEEFRQGMKSFWKKFFRKPAGRVYKELALGKFTKIAEFDIRETDEGLDAVLDDEYTGGKNAEAERALELKGLSMDYVRRNVEAITKMVGEEPVGKELKKIVVIDKKDFYRVVMDKEDRALYILLSVIDKHAILRLMMIPHEVYHTVVTGEIAVEEVLVHVLAFVRAVNTFRKGRNDMQLKELFDRSMIELAELEAGKRNAGKLTQDLVLKDIISLVEEKEAGENREITSEEVFELVLRPTLSYCRNCEEILAFRNIREYFSNRSNEELLNEVEKMWRSQRDNMLRGRPLFAALLLPVTFGDLIYNVLPTELKTVVLYLNIIGMAVALRMAIDNKVDTRLRLMAKRFGNAYKGLRERRLLASAVSAILGEKIPAEYRAGLDAAAVEMADEIPAPMAIEGVSIDNAVGSDMEINVNP
ncbi:hypothetical protein ACFLQ8_01110 [Candidatus Auribacterota bacterium]